jgi:hypothetical protein
LEGLKKADKSGLTETDPKYYKELMDYTANELITNYWNNFI